MKLLFVTTHTYLPDRVGGAESSTHELALELIRLGVEVVVLAKASLPGSSGDFAVDHGLGYTVLRHPQPLEILSLAEAKLYPDWIIGGHELARSVAVLNQMQARCCIYLRDVEFTPVSWRLRELDRALVIANSNFVSRRAHALYGLESVVIPPLVCKERYFVEQRGKNVLFINPIPKKGVEIALAIASARPAWMFDFIEAWPQAYEQMDHYKRRVAQLVNVRWHSAKFDMRKVYGEARVVMVPSLWEEAWCRVVAEAQLSGIPVVASDRGGLRESVGAGGIIVVEYQDVGSWLRAMDTLCDPPTYAAYSEGARRERELPDNEPGALASRFMKVLER